MEKYFTINEVINFEENNMFILIDDNLNNRATVVIKDEVITVYYPNGDVDDFGSNYNKLLEKVDELNYKFIKLTNAEHRWFKFNPNPKNRNIGDCTLRAYCAAFDIEWDDAFDIASEIAKENSSLIEYVSDKVIKDHFGYDVDPDYNKKKVKAKDRITINDFAISHPYGTYILGVRKHLVTVKDGEYWDSWDSGDKKVDTVYIINKPEK